MPTTVLTISDLPENINVTQSENMIPPPFPFEKPTETRRTRLIFDDRHEREKASKSRLRPIGNAQILRCTGVS